MKTLLHILSVILIFLNLGFAQNRKPTDLVDRRAVKDFTAIHASLAADIFLTQADSFSFVAEGRSKLIKLLETEVVNGVLKIRLDRDCDIWDNMEKLTIHISAPSFENIRLSGAGKIQTENTLKGKNLSILMSGANNLHFRDIEMEQLTLELSGVGNIDISGKATQASIDLSGTGNIDVLDLVIQNAHCNISGLGKLSCNVQNDLEAAVSGMGSIRYRGEPKFLRKSVSGIGKVRRD